MCEILFLCGRGERAVIVSLNTAGSDSIKSANRSEDEVRFYHLQQTLCHISSGSFFQLEHPSLFSLMLLVQIDAVILSHMKFIS